MHLTLRDNLIFVTVTVGIQGRQTEIPDVIDLKTLAWDF